MGFYFFWKLTCFLDIPVYSIGTGEKQFDIIDASLSELIGWSNVVGFESDTANVMVGKHNSVLPYVKAKQPNVICQGGDAVLPNCACLQE